MSHTVLRLVALCFGGALLTGCVMAEKYEQEKARSLNFQRLLAQEEKRTGELDAELKKVRRQLTEVESRSREMTSELQSVREQLARSQEEVMALRETATLEQQAKAELGDMPELKGGTLKGMGLGEPTLTTEGRVPIYHEVMPGETLFRLSKTYGVKVDQIREWNGLRDDLIEVGQQLVVGYE